MPQMLSKVIETSKKIENNYLNLIRYNKMKLTVVRLSEFKPSQNYIKKI